VLFSKSYFPKAIFRVLFSEGHFPKAIFRRPFSKSYFPSDFFLIYLGKSFFKKPTQSIWGNHFLKNLPNLSGAESSQKTHPIYLGNLGFKIPTCLEEKRIKFCRLV
jgi:hypothetical protein